MRVGIMSMQRVYNYGSFLQAYALKKTIEKMGHEVVFIDYRPGKPRIHNNSEKSKYIKSLVKKSAFGILDSSRIFLKLGIIPKSVKYSMLSHNSYKTEYWKLLGMGKHKNYDSNVDVLVIGSDEVFNCLQMNVEVGYTRDLFGFNTKAKKTITYAASFGNTTLEALEADGVIEYIKEDFSKINSFSVRDRNSYEIVSSITNRKDIYENFDPVLIHDFSEVKQKTIDMSDYIIVYAYRGRLSADEEKAIKLFAEKRGKKLVAIGGYHKFCDLYIQDSPLEVFNYFRKADFVITDTFHGTIFSVINHAKFGVFVRSGSGEKYGNSEKMMDLLHKLGLEKQIINELSHIESVLEQTIDYKTIDGILLTERNKAIEYLKTNIS